VDPNISKVDGSPHIPVNPIQSTPGLFFILIINGNFNPEMEPLYHIRPYFVGIFPEI
jgi:hypothetical protein